MPAGLRLANADGVGEITICDVVGEQSLLGSPFDAAVDTKRVGAYYYPGSTIEAITVQDSPTRKLHDAQVTLSAATNFPKAKVRSASRLY